MTVGLLILGAESCLTRASQTTDSETRRAQRAVGLLRRSELVSPINVSLCAAVEGCATVRVVGALLGYARVSTGEQELGLQHDALTSSGCLRIFSDTASGALEDRPELARLLDHLREGDTLFVWRLDRLGRSLRHLIDTVAMLAERGVGFVSL